MLHRSASELGEEVADGLARRQIGDEYGTVVEGTIVTQQAGGEWKTVTSGESYYVPAWVVHETKNITDKPARTYNAFIIEKGKPRVIPAE